MNTAKVFCDGRTQAVRLPESCWFDVEEVFAARLGEMVLLFPKHKGWDILARGIECFTEDFMAERDQPTAGDQRKRL